MGMIFFSFIQLLESKFRNEVNNLEQKLTQLQSDIRDKDNQLQAVKSQLIDRDNIIEVSLSTPSEQCEQRSESLLDF